MSDLPNPASFLERLINSRNRDLSLLLPFITGFTSDISTPDSESDSNDRESENPDQLSDRIILISPWTQGIVVIEGRSSASLDSLLRDLMSKEGQPPASKASIEALPRVEIKEGDDTDGECAICLEEWGVGDVAREMPCKHRFHGGCVEKWLKVHGTCPVCRYRMPVEDDHDLGKKESSGQTVESNERESEGRGRRTGIWVNFSIRDSEESRSQRGSSSDESNDSS